MPIIATSSANNLGKNQVLTTIKQKRFQKQLLALVYLPDEAYFKALVAVGKVRTITR